jgi:polygalacturonase
VLSRRELLQAGAAALLSPRLARAEAISLTTPIPPLPWPEAEAIVRATRLPSFGDRVFDVTTYGARGDDATDNTAAFARAIDACHTAGGGHVVIPDGVYATGAIRLRSGVDLHLEPRATLMFAADPARFPVVRTRYEGIECMNRSPMIYALGEHDIAVTGSGTLDASRTEAWNRGCDRGHLEAMVGVAPQQRVVPASGHPLRSAFVEPYGCDAVLIQRVTLRGAQFWQLHPTLCTNVTIDGVTTHADRGNTDGCDPESCERVVITNCSFNDGDDDIAIKSGRDADGRRVGRPSRDIVIANCTMTGSWGAISCGSEQSGGIENVYAYRCLAVRTRFALYVKSSGQRGGYTRNVRLDHVAGYHQTEAFARVEMDYHGQTGAYPPAFADLELAACTGEGAPYALHVTGLLGSPIAGFVVRDSTFRRIAHGNVVRDVRGFQAVASTIDGAPL